jgi:type II secretory pathway component PulC
MRSKGLLSHLGFQPNDRIESINGFRLTSPAGALAAYARLRTANQLRIQVFREDKPVTLEIAIQ